MTLEHGLDDAISIAIDEKRIVGTVVIIAKDGKIIYRKAHGWFDRESQTTMQPNAMFRLASLTKAIVSIAALRLIESGRLHFEDPVTKWLPYFTPPLANGTVPTITIQHLLTHTSGLGYVFLEDQNGPYSQLKISDGLDNAAISLDENLKRLAKAPLSFTPGKGWQYSMSIDVLGGIIEKVTEQDLEAAIQTLITKPLQMEHTRFAIPASWALAVPYANRDPEPVRMTDDAFENPVGLSSITFSPARAYNPKAFYSGGSGMCGSGDDYIKFLEAVRTSSLLKPELTQKIFENQTGRLPIPLAGPGWSWGLIAASLDNPELANMPMPPRSIGWSGAYGHTWWIDPKNEISAVLLTNTSFEGMMGRFPEEIRKVVYTASDVD